MAGSRCRARPARIEDSHVYPAHRTAVCWRHDEIGHGVPDVQRAQLRAARQRSKVLAALIGAAVRPLVRASECAIGCVEIGVGESVFIAAVERPAVLVDQLLDLEVVVCAQRRTGGRLGCRHSEAEEQK